MGSSHALGGKQDGRPGHLDQPNKNIKKMEFVNKITRNVFVITIMKVAKVRVRIRRYVPHQRELKWQKEVSIFQYLILLIKIIKIKTRCQINHAFLFHGVINILISKLTN